MIKYIVTVILLILIIFLGIKMYGEHFDPLPTLDSSVFVHLYDDKGQKLNICLLSKPFGADSDYKLYLSNIDKYIYLGITSYMEFPYIPGNPLDNYILEEKTTKDNSNNAYNLNMYFKLCDAWLHCFRNPVEYIPMDKPMALISESDFVNYKKIKPDSSIKVEYDFMYSCPKVDEKSSCDDWVSYNKNWELCQKCLPVLCLQYKLRGLLVGRKDCPLPEGCEQYITTTGWVDYAEHSKLYKKSRFIFIPNQRDASPRVLTEALACNIPCLVNRNILGGWKYVESGVTGEFFTNETDISSGIDLLLKNMTGYTPRQYIIDNYGPIKSGIKLKEFIFNNFKDKIKNEKGEIVNEQDVKYISIRYHEYSDYNDIA